MMRNRLYSLLFLLASLVVLDPWGCEGAGTGAAYEASSAKIVVEPDLTVTLGYFEQQKFTVTLTDADGNPMADSPVIVGFIGSAHNAHLLLSTVDKDGDPSTLITDGFGTGEVILAAPDKEVEFEIRFSSPAIADAAVVDVEIDSERVGWSLNVNYSGKRQIVKMGASIYEEVSCEDLSTGEEIAPMEVPTEETLPASLEFSGLHYGQTYAVEVNGSSEQGSSRISQLRATTCIDEVLLGKRVTTVELVDIPLEVSGKYSVETQITVDRALDWAVDELIYIADVLFIDNPAEAVLDGIRRVLVGQEPFAGEPYDQLRQERDLDSFLTNHLAASSIDVAESLEPVWLAVKGYLTSISAKGELEIGNQDNGNYYVSHRIDQLVFENEQGSQVEVDLTQLNLPPVIGIGTGRLNNEDIDQLDLNKHQIELGLGSTIYGPFLYGLNEKFATLTFGQALYGIVNCERIADVLAPELDEVTNRVTIHSGCEFATKEANKLIGPSVVLLNDKYPELVFEGSCYLEDSIDSIQVAELVNGTFSVTWKGDNSASDIGPLEASFEAELLNNW
ncbi:MAG: hypothetical protein GY847_04235 [Proteobacteria bacterium]|nr:hypothetical protein [Pseudomonadota bacterium]